MKKNTKKSASLKYYVPTGLQILFVGAITLAFIAGLAQMLWQILSISNQEFDTSYWSVFLATDQLLPVLLFLIAYVLNPRRLHVIGRAFESMLIASIGVMTWWACTYTFPLLPQGDSLYGFYPLYQIIGALILVVIFSTILFWAKATKRWQ